MITTITLALLLASSAAINILLFYYAKKCVEKIVMFHDGLEELQAELQEYTKHCYDLTRSEVMYKDPVIMNLYEQTKSIGDRCQEFKESFTVVYDDEEVDEFLEGENDEQQ